MSVSHQTTLLIGGSNGTATLCAILGDKSNPVNANHTLRVATRSAQTYLDNTNNNADATLDAASLSPRVWRCQEKKHISDLLSANFFPTRVVTHVGAPDSVFVYGNDDHNDKHHASSNELSPLERAISGISATDNGGIVDVIILACPVSAHLALLRRLAKALYNLDARGLLGSSNRPPIFIGTLYGAGGFDWMSRIAFYEARPANFTKWQRPLGLFALKAFPYLCKSLKAGEVTLHGRFPQLQVAISPSNAYCRYHVQILLDRVLQNETTSKKLDFLGLSSDRKLGGDGTVVEEDMVWRNRSLLGGDVGNVLESVTVARNAMVLAAQTHKQLKQAKEGSTVSAPPHILSTTTASIHQPTPSRSFPLLSPSLELLLTHSLSDHADPYSSLGFLSCTLNSTNQILHPCILVALFGGSEDGSSDVFGANDVGMISWNTKKEQTPLPRFYADGAARPLAGQLITAIAGGEMYFVIDAIERLLTPRGYDPITALHGGEPIGRKVMNWLGNSPHDLGERSGLTGVALRREWQVLFGKEKDSEKVNDSGGAGGNIPGIIHREGTLAKLMGFGLTHNSRLGAVLSPCIIDESSKDNEDGIIRIKPNPTTRFFTDDVQHGLCIYLGLAELLGFDLEHDMKTMLYVVRRLQHWMKKEFVLPEGAKVPPNGGGIVCSAKDVGETSAPQAFGVRSVQELRQFLRLDVFGEVLQTRAEDRLKESGLVSRL